MHFNSSSSLLDMNFKVSQNYSLNNEYWELSVGLLLTAIGVQKFPNFKYHEL